MLRAYKYRLYPTKEQSETIDKTISVCRFVYNLALETKLYAYKSHGKNLSAIDLCYQLVSLRKDYPWIAVADSQAAQASIKKLDKSFQNFFRGEGFPKFKSKKNGGSFQCPNNTRRIDWENSTLTIPKIKSIPIVLSRKFEGEIKTITISKTTTHKYFASILVLTHQEKIAPNLINPETTIGLDVGIKSFVVTSAGKYFEPNRKLKNNLARLKHLSRSVSRKKKGSNNRKKATKCLATLHEKITNQRTSYIHQVTTQLIRDNQAESFVIETLNVVGMLKNRSLSQAISDVSFGEFFRQMKYKCNWYGKNLISIGRFEPSSKTCSNCGTINETLKLADREWVCVKCGATHERDFNAAKNIRNAGLKQTIFQNHSGAGSSGESAELRRLRRAKKQKYTHKVKLVL